MEKAVILYELRTVISQTHTIVYPKKLGAFKTKFVPTNFALNIVNDVDEVKQMIDPAMTFKFWQLDNMEDGIDIVTEAISKYNEDEQMDAEEVKSIILAQDNLNTSGTIYLCLFSHSEFVV